MLKIKSAGMDIPVVKWEEKRLPRRVLAIRLQAMGDLVITLPYLQQLRNSLPPDTVLDLLTREEVDSIPRHLHLFSHVYAIGGGRNTKKQLLHTAWLIPFLLSRRYEVVIDLQDNIISRLVRKCLFPKAWSQFDRFSPVAAGERTSATIEAIGLGRCAAALGFTMINEPSAIKLLQEGGWRKDHQLVVLNPAGAFKTRNWPMGYYVRFALLWLERFPKTQFLMMGTDFIAEQAVFLMGQLEDKVISLIGKTKPAEAFAIIQKLSFILSEDSGLMHMGWVSGIPTMALFGSTQSAKAKPLGALSDYVDSADLPCGGCMLEHCKYGDTHCLTRYTPEMIFDRSMALMERVQLSTPGMLKEAH
jgi:ADP-heptose:LPS heptosyltransferase